MIYLRSARSSASLAKPYRRDRPSKCLNHSGVGAAFDAQTQISFDSPDENHRSKFHSCKPADYSQIDARDLDDSLPRGFLVRPVVKVWMIHRLDWASKLPGRRRKELP